jgi:predicted methyltransferase
VSAATPRRRASAAHAPQSAWVLALLVLLLASVLAADDRATATHRFDDVAYWRTVFDAPERDAWQKPAALVAALRIPAGATVVDLGAGTGYFAPHLSRAVGPDGAVLAVEVEPRLVAHLRDRAEREQLANLTPVLASLDTPRLARTSADLILVVDTYHHLDHRRRYLPQLARALRPGGRVAVVDWKPGRLPEGPDPEHKLTAEQVVAEMQAAGFELVARPDLLPYHYVLIFDAKPRSPEGEASGP